MTSPPFRGEGALVTGQVYGSDVVIAALDRLGITEIAFNPGASYRGLHESMVHLDRHRAVLCLSEGVAVAAAHGYAKAAGRPMAVFLHNLVGLQSAAMALFNAWVDQAPVLALGGAGPSDRTRRRPWIDWIHTANPQAAPARDTIEWDDAPTSLPAVVESLARAHRLATTAPWGPTYVAVDALLQEDLAPAISLDQLTAVPGPGFVPPPERVTAIVEALLSAQLPVILADRVGRSRAGFDALRVIAERTGSTVVDLGGRHNFPNTHPLRARTGRAEALAHADLILALDVRDLRWATSRVDVGSREVTSLLDPAARVISLGVSDLQHRGFIEPEGRDLAKHDAFIADTEATLPWLADLVAERTTPPADGAFPRRAVDPIGPSGDTISDTLLAAATFDAVRTGPWRLGHGSLRGAVDATWELEGFGSHLGGSGGAGLGYGVGATVGAALAAAADDEDLITVSLQPEGDLLYTPAGLWTAARERLPILFVVANNRTYRQDLMHQSVMARTRERPLEHAHVGIDLEDPTIDVAGLASSQGVEAFGPIAAAHQLHDTLANAARIVRSEGRPVLVDVHTAA